MSQNRICSEEEIQTLKYKTDKVLYDFVSITEKQKDNNKHLMPEIKEQNLTVLIKEGSPVRISESRWPVPNGTGIAKMKYLSACVRHQVRGMQII